MSFKQCLPNVLMIRIGIDKKKKVFIFMSLDECYLPCEEDSVYLQEIWILIELNNKMLFLK